MKFEKLMRDDAGKMMEKWLENHDDLPAVNAEYKAIRADIDEEYKKIRKDNPAGKEYISDVRLGIFLYEYLNRKGLTLREASDESVWRYLSLAVSPDLVSERWGYDNEDHFWKKPLRIWFSSLWWYVHLSWQSNAADTEKLLLTQGFSSDTILNLVERPGKFGTFTEVMRKIMFYFPRVPEYSSVMSEKDNTAVKKKTDKEKLFRTILKLHTSKSLNIEPDLYEGGSDGYVLSLYREAGVTF